MIINVLHKTKNRITVDIRCHQIRYLENFAKHGPVEFIDISQTTAEAYEFLFKENRASFLSCLAEDVTNDSPYVVRVQDLTVEEPTQTEASPCTL